MFFSTKLATVLLALAATTQASVLPRISPKFEEQQAQVSVIFWDNANRTGAAYSPDGLVQAVCNTLPTDWLDRAQSVQIATGFSCIFFVFEGCEGTGVTISGAGNLPDELGGNVESFLCTKSI